MSDNANVQTTDTVQPTAAEQLIALLGQMDSNAILAVIAEKQRLEKAAAEAAFAAKTERIAQRMKTINEALAGLNPMFADFNKAENTQLHIAFDAEVGGYVVRNAVAPKAQTIAKRVPRAQVFVANQGVSTINALVAATTKGKRQMCMDANGQLHASLADCARDAYGLDNAAIYTEGGGHAGRAMDKLNLVYTMVEAQ